MIEGLRIGHWTGAATGVTVIIAPSGTVGSGEVLGTGLDARLFTDLSTLTADT